MPDTDPPPTEPTPILHAAAGTKPPPAPVVAPETKQYVDDAVAAAFLVVQEHFDKGVAALLGGLKENHRVLEAVLEALEREQAARRRGLGILKGDIREVETRLNEKIQRVAQGLPPEVPPAGPNGS